MQNEVGGHYLIKCACGALNAELRMGLTDVAAHLTTSWSSQPTWVAPQLGINTATISPANASQSPAFPELSGIDWHGRSSRFRRIPGGQKTERDGRT